MKSIKIANYSIYSNGSYTKENKNFLKMYKGVRVNVSVESQDYIHFSIRTKKVKDTIWKRKHEMMKSLIFNDIEHTIFCDFEKEPENKCKNVLVFDEEVYNELKMNIPIFMSECGCKFTTNETSNQLELVFNN